MAPNDTKVLELMLRGVTSNTVIAKEAGIPAGTVGTIKRKQEFIDELARRQQLVKTKASDKRAKAVTEARDILTEALPDAAMGIVTLSKTASSDKVKLDALKTILAEGIPRGTDDDGSKAGRITMDAAGFRAIMETFAESRQGRRVASAVIEQPA